VKDVVEVVPPPENGNGNGAENGEDDKNGTAAQISDFEEEGGPGVPENGGKGNENGQKKNNNPLDGFDFRLKEAPSPANKKNGGGGGGMKN
jgi:hypothetical protein